MSQTRQQKRAFQKKKQKELERAGRSNRHPNGITEKNLEHFSAIGENSPFKFKKSKTTNEFALDITKLKPPEKQYNADCFEIERFPGYSDLYFGQKSPRNRSGDLLNSYVLRISNQLIKKIFIEGHKDFYEKLFNQVLLTNEHYNHFKIKLEDQFPTAPGVQIFEMINFVYGAYGAEVSDLMFYRIDPAHIHYLSSGKPSIIKPDGEGIDGIITVSLPLDLLAYFYRIILDKKDEFI